MKKRTILSFAAALLVSLNAGAFGLETVENAAEPTGAVTGTTLADDIDIPLADEKYGNLIWYNNYETKNEHEALYAQEGMSFIASGNTANTSVEADPDTEKGGKAVKVNGQGAHGGYELTFTGGGLTQPGTYTFIMDVYIPDGGTTGGMWLRYETTKQDGSSSDPNYWDHPLKSTGKWYTWTQSMTISANDEYKAINVYSVRSSSVQDYYVDNVRVYCNPMAGEGQIFLKEGATQTLVTINGNTYTFPEPINKTDFIAWYNAETGAKYAAGATADKAAISGKTFTAFHQNAEAPAMGFSFEGGKSGAGVEGFTDTVITDDNRSVLRLHMVPGGSWDASSANYKNDARVWLISAYDDRFTAFDPHEYNMVSYCYKIVKAVDTTKKVAPEELTESDLVANGTPWFAINYSLSNDYGGFHHGTTEHKIGGNHKTTVGDYQIFTADMAVAANSIAAYPWDSVDTMYGFVIQPNASNYESITYIDYIRVYRDGITTVTYDTNAAEYEELGYTVQYDVPEETGRGLGSGYLLTGDKPVLEGHTFVGWALTPDATPADVVTSIELTGDTTVYAVWVEEGTFVPRTINKNSLRTGAVSGIRFASIINLSVKAGLSAAFEGVEPDEYGFIVSRKVLLNGETLTFGTAPNEKGVGVTPNGATYVSGVAFDKAKGINRVYDNDGSKFSEVTAGKNEAFTAILTGIPEENYGDTLVARPYIKIGGLYFYGRAREMSMKSVAEDLKANYDSLTDAEKELVDKILAA